MKKSLVVAILFSLIILNPVHAETPEQVTGIWHLSEDLTVSSLMSDIYLVEHRFPWPANSLLVRCSATEMLWIDTPYTGEATRLVHDWTIRQFGRLSHTAINSGCQVNNLGGNSFLRSQGIPVHGADLTARRFAETSERKRQQMISGLAAPAMERYRETHAHLVYTPPDTLFEIRKGLHLVIGEQVVKAIYPGPGYAKDNLVVWLPGKGLLFAGCMVEAKETGSLGFTDDADLEQWPLSLSRLVATLDGVRTVVPGHGEPGNRELIWHTLALFQDGDRR